MSAWSHGEARDDDEGSAGLDIRCGPTGDSSADGAGAEEGTADAASAGGSCAGSASASGGGGWEFHETDDISDILDVGLGGVHESRLRFWSRTGTSSAPFSGRE